VAAAAAGVFHTCALTSSAGVKCWGRNVRGELGDGTTTERDTPVDVTGLTSRAAAVAAGYVHTCAVTTDGGVKCWGSNSEGQLGDGTTIDRHTPVDVAGLASTAAAVTGGSAHTCALTTGGGVQCWGRNESGQLGDGTTTGRRTPVDVILQANGVAAVAAGQVHTCAVTTGGGVKCWGWNRYGQLGDGTTIDRLTPVDVVGLTSGVAAVAAGDNHSCALTTAGAVKCWGSNVNGELGDGTTTARLTPTEMTGLTSFAAGVATGMCHTCVLTTGGEILCTGANSGGELGDGTTTKSLTPIPVRGFGQSNVDVDHVTEPTVFRRKTGAWWGLLSRQPRTRLFGYLHVVWGLSGDVRVAR
jgi:alpha-tubulin suppressor-like RCC1 family protein